MVIAADEEAIEVTAAELRGFGAGVEAVEADLATMEGVDRLIAALRGRPVVALLANAGRGLATAFSSRTSTRSGTSSRPTSPARCG